MKDAAEPNLQKFIAGEICLDFANTLDWHASDEPRETLMSYADLVVWCRSAGLFDRARQEVLLREAQRHPTSAARVLKQAISLREVIYRISVSIIHQEPSPRTDLDRLNQAIQSAFRHRRVVRSKLGFEWDWQWNDLDLDSLLWPIVRSAADLLTSENRERIGQCADDRGCGWLFLDTSKNRSRRWCQMADCGNRAKAQRHYQRRRKGRAQDKR